MDRYDSQSEYNFVHNLPWHCHCSSRCPMAPQSTAARRTSASIRCLARDAFTLVEIMIVVAIIGLLAAVMVGSMVKARKQSEVSRVMNDIREIDATITQWAVDANKKDGD